MAHRTRRFVIDCETNAIDFDAWHKGDFSSLKSVHCLVAIDADTNKVYRFREERVRDGIIWIFNQANEVIAHYAKFDVQVIESYIGAKFPKEVVITCTQKMAKELFPNGYREDRVPEGQRGRHKLETWGFRLGIHKGLFNKKTNPFSQYSDEMMEYCVRDCTVTLALHRFLSRRKRWGKLASIFDYFSPIEEPQVV